MNLQRQFFDPPATVRYHALDKVQTQDAGEQYWGECHAAPDGTFWLDEEVMNEHLLELDVDKVTTFLKNTEEWVEEYVKSDDYMHDYLYILKE